VLVLNLFAVGGDAIFERLEESVTDGHRRRLKKL
jgi:hypothetical protein